MIRQLKREWLSVSHIIYFQLSFIMLMMSFGLFIDYNGTMTMIAIIMYPMIFPTLIVVMDQPYQITMNALPIRRRDYILSKYLFGYAVSLSMILIGLLFSYLVTEFIVTEGVLLKPFISYQGILICLLPTIVLSGLTLPIYFNFATRKGSIVLMLLYGALALAILIGLVYLEKTIDTAYYYSEKEIFPVLTRLISEKIDQFGKIKFMRAIFTGSIIYTLLSVSLSILCFNRKDIGE
ncbi:MULTISPECIES: ABC-2 transporter permease [unclassified Fusibacter]|uniref:ABC-2 transporter permease n=1 Tax=unclassified Fusibacter TaxID=2624464 RepID=UPI0010111C24|nr:MULTISPECIES: ABC-2 transporter permease [unclassified Fusibacter]MCK8061107.1 ABC-2 transporter permease [Fusibacter sp. A2]NPE23357.1 hypothetical protein [Fusibacter sp. A1]RXV59402.1 hypothetical protein DWB64_16185 [Fusibacter sp. A1]